MADALPGLIKDYAGRFSAALLGKHGVASPLGAWLLLALFAPAAARERRETLEMVLATDADRAFELARGLLEDPHPAVAAGTAFWRRPELVAGALRQWEASLPSSTEVGPVPNQAEADAWAKRNTRDLIRAFPGSVEGMAMVLASALASRIEWSTPFDLTDSEDLGGRAW